MFPKLSNCNKIPKKRVEATLKNVKDAIASGSMLSIKDVRDVFNKEGMHIGQSLYIKVLEHCHWQSQFHPEYYLSHPNFQGLKVDNYLSPTLTDNLEKVHNMERNCLRLTTWVNQYGWPIKNNQDYYFHFFTIF